MVGNLTQSGRDFNSSNAASLKGKLQSLEVNKELNLKKTSFKINDFYAEEFKSSP